MTLDTSALATVELRHPRHGLHRRLNDEQQRSLADLYRVNASAVFFVCNFLLRNPEDAADATQEVFLKAVDSLGRRSTAEHARSWLLAAAQKHCLDVLQRHRHVERIVTNPVADPAGDADPETAVVERDLVAAVFRELRVRERHALWQWAVESRPLAEIANEMGLSYTAVQQLLFRARRHAASVAARVAALLGLLQLGRALRRASHAYQLALVAAAVPVVLATMPSSSTAPHAPSTPPSHLGTDASQAHAFPSPLAGEGQGGGLKAQGRRVIEVSGVPVSVPAVPVSLPSVSLEGATSTVDKAISTLERSTRQLMRRIGTESGMEPPPVTLPIKVGGL